MAKKILIVDDSALMRRVISDIINSDERFTVEDTAKDGLEGLDKITKSGNRFDVILLDINMPRMNGLELMAELSKLRVRPPVIIVSTLAKDGADETIKALELGAFDFVTKPGSFAGMKSDDLKADLIAKVAAACHLAPKKSVAKPAVVTPVKPEVFIPKSRPARTNGKTLIALACSTGGPKALQTVMPMLPEKLNAAMLIVQHMPEGFTLSLCERLNEMSVVNIKEAADGDILRKDQVYLAKGGFQMKFKESASGNFLSLTKDPPRGGLRPCADIMYESLVGSAYEKIVCVVLTGMGADGTSGIRQLKETNNVYVIAQDEPTCVVYGMPRAIYEAGLVDEVKPLDQIADAIARATGVR
ncbi:MAG: chemotaxis response regulator protein-glutamate methylesterase [Catonella sp.]|nr:chemotaxis response regulator protein-glutamate methylesterase [Catonella sp.]MDY6356159.1 chemotaxis response regulator protein-glutamate methylesterase [Catonella sp.]